ncbi:MAG TPA: GlsB/YeaQ/YmgE family stress response membrane protein [Anaerolineales bacterium]|nr:GlsB/YeaQ/YmgE family stress response membrane protein [Anaerolineales bacterium]
MINFIVWLIAGAIIGWLASGIMGTNGQQGLLMDIVVGVVGAFVAGWFITPLVGVGTINQNNFSLPALVVSLVGAVILLAVVGFFRRGGLRTR